jgi:diadenosine tetraphosphate (Ap4A) HIT family hydrolase
MDPNDAAAYWLEILTVARALKIVFDPSQVNLMTWGNLDPHVHTHVVLRYLDDPCPGKPLMPFEAEPVPEEDLHDQVTRLREVMRPT